MPNDVWEHPLYLTYNTFDVMRRHKDFFRHSAMPRASVVIERPYNEADYFVAQYLDDDTTTHKNADSVGFPCSIADIKKEV